MSASAELPNLRTLCIYCGSAPGHDPAYAAAAQELGSAMAAAGVALVYGGNNHGLMGIVARAVLAGGGRVTGITPGFLLREEAVPDARCEQIVVPDMHTRKRLMFERADAFCALPGGIGTLEEVVEQLTWVQLAQHTKPVLLADVAGFWQPLLTLFDHMRAHRFIQPRTETTYLVTQDVSAILPMLDAALERPATPQTALRPEL